MEGILSRMFFSRSKGKEKTSSIVENLSQGKVNKEYIITGIKSNDEEMEKFLFSLGCYSGEPITLVSRKKAGCVVSIKDGRYSIDNQLASAIVV